MKCQATLPPTQIYLISDVACQIFFAVIGHSFSTIFIAAAVLCCQERHSAFAFIHYKIPHRVFPIAFFPFNFYIVTKHYIHAKQKVQCCT